MESPGEYLKRERELRGVSLARIHESTRVPMKYLEAIEKDEYEGIHPTFVKGYIKSYCKVLGLDETDAALRFEVYIREHAADAGRAEQARPAVRKKTEAPAPAGEGAKKSLNAFILAGAGVVIVAIIYFVAINKGPAPTVEPPTAEVEEVKPPEATAPAPVPGEQATSAPPEAQVQPEPQKTEKKAEAPAEKAPVEKPAAPVKPAPQAPAQKPAVTAPAPTAPVAPAAPLAGDKPQAAAEQAVKKHSLSVSATEQAWVKVGIDGAEPFDVLLREGESVSWRASENFQVTIGNAGGVDVTYDGKQMPKLGESGQVVHMTLPGGVTKARPMPAPVAPKETEPAINMPAPAENQGQ